MRAMRTLPLSVIALSLLSVSPLAFANEAGCTPQQCGKTSAIFWDVWKTDPNLDAIEYLHGQGIVEGYANGSFEPDAEINRAEFVKIVTGAQFNASGTVDTCMNEFPQSRFPDVRTSDWFAKYVCVAESKSIVGGYPDGTFRPGASISFVEASKILVRVFVGDVESDAVWYKPYVEKLAQFNAIPLSIQSFDQPITRGEMAEMIYRLKTGNTDKQSKAYGDIGMKTYVNATQKISFSYPQSYSIVEDGVHARYESVPDWYRIELHHTDGAVFTIEVNPDGYGPIFADEVFALYDRSGGSIGGIEPTDDEVSETAQNDNWRVLVGSSFESDNGMTYYFRLEYPEGQDRDQDFTDLVRSVRMAD